MIQFGALLDDGEDVVLAHDDELFAVDLDLGAGVAGEDDFVALLDGKGRAFAVVETAAVADGEDLAALGLFLGGVGEDDAALGLGFGLDTLDEDLVAERTQFSHWATPFLRSCQCKLPVISCQLPVQTREREPLPLPYF